jgi:hypothetical protein
MPDWMNETIYSLRTDSPYYHEMLETEREHGEMMRARAADERMDAYIDSLEFDEDEDE